MGMTRADWAAVFLAGVLIVIIAVSVIYVITVIVQGIADVLTAVIAASATILVAILTHLFTAYREQSQRLQGQRQQNYAELLKLIGEFIRNPDECRDEFDTALLFSWVCGSAKVIESTAGFRERRTSSNLQGLLVAMREDMGVDRPDVGQNWVRGLFGTKRAPLSLEIDDGHE